MKFCKMCENMLYPTEVDNKLLLQCKNCGFNKEHDDIIISSKIYKESQDNVQSLTNKYLIYDPTLPRTSKKKCPNEICISHQDKQKQEAVFFPIKKTMELIYICTACNTEWKYT